MWWWLGLLLSVVFGQDLYIGSEFLLLRFHRGFYPPLLGTGIMGGASIPLFRSGETYQLRGWGEARLMHIVGGNRVPFSPGATAGVSARADIPSRLRIYAQVGLGLDAHSINFTDKGGSTLIDRQLRPIVIAEVGSFAFAEGIFLRYGFYPTPGTTGKFVVTIGSYVGD